MGKTANDLAVLCGLDVPESRLESFSSYGDTFIVKRFDRNKKQRIHFTSSMTLLGKIDGEKESSYLDIVSFLNKNGAMPQKDLRELWKRIVFNMAISNTDDHLRNHGFILTKTGWRLSPLYDINPVPYGNTLSLDVSDDDNRIDISLALDTAKFYGIKYDDAKKISSDILMMVGDNWERLAKGNGLSRSEIEMMRPAFSACLN